MPRRTAPLRKVADSRVERDKSSAGEKRRHAQISWASWRSDMTTAGSSPPVQGAQAREGERVAALPVVALKPGEVLGDKVAVGAPVRGETDERPSPILSIPARPSRSGVARRHAMFRLLPRR